MAKTSRSNNVIWLLGLFIIGGIIGNCIGDALIRVCPMLAFLAKQQSIGISPTTLSLNVFTVTFGFSFQINFFSILGFILAYYIYRRI